MPPYQGINLAELDAYLEAEDAHREYRTSTTNKLVNFAISTNTLSSSGGNSYAGTANPAGKRLNDFVNKMVNVGLKASGNFWSADVPDGSPWTEPVVHLTFSGSKDTAASSIYLSIEQLKQLLDGTGLVFKLGGHHIICSITGDWSVYDARIKRYKNIKFGEQSKFFDIISDGLGRL